MGLFCAAMSPEVSVLLQPAVTVLCGLLLIVLVNVVGSSILGKIRIKLGDYESVLMSILLGYLVLSFFLLLGIVGWNTIFTPIVLAIAGFCWYHRSSVRVNPPIAWSVIFLQMVVFLLFAVYRFALVYNFDDASFSYFFMDDYSYQDSITAIYSFGEEKNCSELLNKDFGYPSYYSVYHYFTFSLSVALRKITSFNVYFQFHFFLVPFFQMLAFLGLYLISRSITKKPVLALLIAATCLASLRYNLIHMIVQALPYSFFLKKSIILKPFFGFQFLNSGFGLKFCISIFLMACFFTLIDKKKLVPLSALVLYIHPLLLILLFSVQGVAILFVRHYRQALVSALFFIPLMVFLAIQEFRPHQPAMPEIMANLEQVFRIPLKQYLVIILSQFFNEFYGVLLLPFLLIAFTRKQISEILLATSLVAYPFIETLPLPKWITSMYFAALLFLFLWVLQRNRRNRYFIFLILCSVVVVAMEPFSQLMPNFNQVFMLVAYPGMILLCCYLLSCVFQNDFKPLHLGLLILFGLSNLGLNFRESIIRKIRIFPEKAYQHDVSKAVTERTKRAYMGIFDSKMTSIVFANQYFYGEEIQWFNDLVFPVFLAIPALEGDSSVSQKNARMNNPIWSFSKTVPDSLSDDEKAMRFCQTFRIPYIIVKDYDKVLTPKTRALYSDSVHHTESHYTVYFRPKGFSTTGK